MRAHYNTVLLMVFVVSLIVPSMASADQDAGVDDAGVDDAGVDGGDLGNDGDWGDDGDWGEGNSDSEDGWDDAGGFGDDGNGGKPSVRIHGAFENQLTAMVLRLYNGGERFTVYDYTRIRVDLDADLPGGLELRSDVVARVFVGETEIYLVNFIPKQTYDDLMARDPRWAMFAEDKYSFENEYLIDNVYLKVPIARALASIGKQPLEQGAGYVWNPTDVFTEKDMFDPTYEKPGVIAARLVIPIGDMASLDLVGVPDGSFDHWIGGGRASLRAGPISMSAASYVSRVERTDMEGSMDAMLAAVMMGQDPEDAILRTDAQRILVGGDVVADIEGVRLWAEGAYNFIEDKDGAPDDWWELTGGVEYFFSFETHVMAEYYHYDRGPTQEGGTYSFNHWMGLMASDYKMLGRDFLFESFDHPVADFWTLGVSSFQSITDGSAAIMADLRWEFSQDAELWLMLAGNLGEPEDFLSASYAQGWLRLKAYF
jgi:hypothetical protein